MFLLNLILNDVTFLQVKVEVNVPEHDHLRSIKLDLLERHTTPVLKDDNALSLGNGFMVMYECHKFTLIYFVQSFSEIFIIFIQESEVIQWKRKGNPTIT